MKAVGAKLSLIVALAVGANAFALSVSRSSSASSVASRQAGSVDTASSLTEIERVISGLERQVATTPTSSSLDLLARMQLSRGRITGDASSFARAQNAIEQSLRIAPKNLEGRTLDAEIRYTNHEFATARVLSAAIVKESPREIAALAVRADAERELGDYRAAANTMRELRRVAPDSPSVIVRDARLEFLTGDAVRAVSLAERAERRAEQSGLLGATLSFYPSFRGQLALDTGNYRQAVKHFTRARSIASGDRVASAGLARALAASGKHEAAVELLEDLTDRYPDPTALALLGDLRSKLGDQKGAEDAYALVEAVAELASSNQQIYDRDLATFYANHDRSLAKAVRMARAELKVRKDVYAYDTLAWAEYMTGNYKAAESAIRRALAVGTADARIHFHAGMIFSETANAALAIDHLRTALKISPNFDVFSADVARDELKRLGGKS